MRKPLLAATVGMVFLLGAGTRAQTGGGVYISDDFGRTWRMQATIIPRDARVMVLERKGERLLAATEGHGLFLSDAKREEWTQIGAGLPGVKITAVLGVGSEIYAGVFRQGLYASTDEGKSWVSQNGNLANVNVRAILAVDGALLMATDGGIFKRAAGQTNWRPVFSAGQVVSLNQGGSRIVAGGVRGTLLSSDAGEHWDWISQEGAAHTTAIVGEKIVVMNISGDLLITDDWGKSWRKTEYRPKTGSYVYETVQAGKYLLLSNNYGIHRSADAGRNWELLFNTEAIAFMDLIVFENRVYGGTVAWNERRGRLLPRQ